MEDTLANTSYEETTVYFSNTTECGDNDYGCWSDERFIKEINDYIFPKVYEWIFIVLNILVFIFGLGGNFLVCFAVYRNKHLQSVTNYFLVNLAVADFMVVLICLPPTLVHDIAQTWFLGIVMCKLIMYLQNVSVLVSALTLTAISIERFLAICHPLSHRVSKFKTRLAVFLIWMISLSAAAPNLWFLTLHPDPMVPQHITILLTSCKPLDDLDELKFFLFLSIAFFFFPVLIMGYTYFRISRCLWTSTTAGPARINSTSQGAVHNIRARKRTAKMLIVVVLVFIACYLPVYLLNILRYVGVIGSVTNHDVVMIIALTSHWLCYYNSSVNPIIYNFMSEKFRKEFKVACSCCTKLYYSIRRKKGYSSGMIYLHHKGHGNISPVHGGGRNYTDSSAVHTETIRLKTAVGV